MNAVSGSGSSVIAKPISIRFSTTAVPPVSPRRKRPDAGCVIVADSAHRRQAVLSALPAGHSCLLRHAAIASLHTITRAPAASNPPLGVFLNIDPADTCKPPGWESASADARRGHRSRRDRSGGGEIFWRRS